MNKLTFLTDHGKQLVLKAIADKRNFITGCYAFASGERRKKAKLFNEELIFAANKISFNRALTAREIELITEVVEVEIKLRTKLAEEKDKQYTYPGYEEDIQLLKNILADLRIIQMVNDCLKLDALL